MAEKATPAKAEPGLGALVKVLPLPAGMYMFSVRAETEAKIALGGLPVPSLHVIGAPGTAPGALEFMHGPDTSGGWLFTNNAMFVLRVNGSGARLILTSVRGERGEILGMKIERLGAGAAAPMLSEPAVPPAAAQPAAKRPAKVKLEGLRLKLGAHVRGRGDLSFTDSEWAGRVGPGLWIESFSITPLEHLGEKDIEYKGLTASGFETPWISNGAPCGTRGMSVALIGFGVRLKPEAAAAYDCEYRGYFKSGVIVGPLRNGAPCRSTVAGDALEGISVRIVKRGSKARPGAKSGTAARKARTVTGPAFSQLRQEASRLAPVAGRKAPTKHAADKGQAKAQAAAKAGARQKWSLWKATARRGSKTRSKSKA
jgi:hypothetical protein